MKNIIIAVDGYSGTGKGTIASHIAKHYGFYYLDTGIYYRSLAYLVIKNNIDKNNIDEMLNILKNMSIRISDNVILNGDDVSKEIRSMEVDELVGYISSISSVRLLINDKIRNYCYNKQIVVDGRDIGTLVFPDANYKIFLDASVDTRARRRFNQNIERGIDCSYEEILNNMKLRDNYDNTREIGKLIPADDAIIIDTTNIDVETTINKVIEIIGSEIK